MNTREIKFRAWDEKKKKMFIPEYINNPPSENFEPIMQFTGLKDKNGRDIYEGDIISHPTSKPFQRTVVRFNGERGSFSCWSETEKGWVTRDYINISNNREVIGNIYENPELLT